MHRIRALNPSGTPGFLVGVASSTCCYTATHDRTALAGPCVSRRGEACFRRGGLRTRFLGGPVGKGTPVCRAHVLGAHWNYSGPSGRTLADQAEQHWSDRDREGHGFGDCRDALPALVSVRRHVGKLPACPATASPPPPPIPAVTESKLSGMELSASQRAGPTANCVVSKTQRNAYFLHVPGEQRVLWRVTLFSCNVFLLRWPLSCATTGDKQGSFFSAVGGKGPTRNALTESLDFNVKIGSLKEGGGSISLRLAQ